MFWFSTHCEGLISQVSRTDPIDTVEHIYDACPKYSELGNFRIIAYLMLARVAAADSASTVEKSSFYI